MIETEAFGNTSGLLHTLSDRLKAEMGRLLL